tara:strand:+ start:3360 stop:3935 length:576 start_codon:yes stop_codon:yes gene_type:complete
MIDVDSVTGGENEEFILVHTGSSMPRRLDQKTSYWELSLIIRTTMEYSRLDHVVLTVDVVKRRISRIFKLKILEIKQNYCVYHVTGIAPPKELFDLQSGNYFADITIVDKLGCNLFDLPTSCSIEFTEPKYGTEIAPIWLGLRRARKNQPPPPPPKPEYGEKLVHTAELVVDMGQIVEDSEQGKIVKMKMN